MFHFNVVAVMLVGFTLQMGNVAALSMPRAVSGLDNFDGLGLIGFPYNITQDRFGTLQYDPEILATTFGGATQKVFSVGIKPESGLNEAVFRSDVILSSPKKCVLLKSMYFGCNQRGVEPEINFPLSCDIKIEALGPKQADGTEEVLYTTMKSFVPKLRVGIMPLKIFSPMEEVVIDPKPKVASKYRVSALSTDTRRANAFIKLVEDSGNLLEPLLKILGLTLGELVANLKALLVKAGDELVDLLIDNVTYETDVDCPLLGS
ncbi:hypothetical protein DE146DRAFT_736984 [Phaeosphaeria sp. MPI-PUGE-AT-0046c]|nr:hypothetical protein DE146DRAFT_736984 [Phaeosphaeria sp. MPI-PUGE-AT-0046c]